MLNRTIRLILNSTSQNLVEGLTLKHRGYIYIALTTDGSQWVKLYGQGLSYYGEDGARSNAA